VKLCAPAVGRRREKERLAFFILVVNI
jgi:hypothetical protein